MNNLQKIGLRNLGTLAEVDSEARRRMYEQNQIESESKANAIGALIGNVAGLGMAGYSEYQKNKPMDKPPGGEQAIGKAAKEAVSSNKVLGENSVIAEKAPSLSQAKSTQAQDQLGMYRPEILNAPDEATFNGAQDEYWRDLRDSVKDRSIVSLQSPMRTRLGRAYRDTSPDFQEKFGQVLAGWSPFIGAPQ